MKSKTKRLVYGVGINDADYVTQKFQELDPINGKRRQKLIWICPFYLTWRHMLERCYSSKYQKTHPAYVGCSVIEEWHTFSNFKSWMEIQDWKGKQLDKDVLSAGSRIYGTETCVFVSRQINIFLTDSAATRGEYPIGVYWSKVHQKFKACCGNPFTGKQKSLGYFLCPNEAHMAWLKYKLEIAKKLAAEQDDPRVAEALIKRYENYGR